MVGGHRRSTNTISFMTFIIIYTSHTHTHTHTQKTKTKKMGKIKSFLTDSQPGYAFTVLNFFYSQPERSHIKGSLKEKKKSVYNSMRIKRK